MGMGDVPLRTLGLGPGIRMGLGSPNAVGARVGCLAGRGRLLRLGATGAVREIWSNRDH